MMNLRSNQVENVILSYFYCFFSTTFTGDFMPFLAEVFIVSLPYYTCGELIERFGGPLGGFCCHWYTMLLYRPKMYLIAQTVDHSFL